MTVPPPEVALDDRATPASETRSASRWATLVLTAVLAALPMVRMARLVRSGSATQYADYWLMLPTSIQSNRMPDIEGLFTFSNEHPVVIPKIIFWLNTILFGGSNISLGFYVVATVAAQVVIIGLILRETSHLGRLARCVLLVTASALLFTRLGSWNFLKAMSGTAWLTANTFALAAIYVRQRDRQLPALVLGLAATLSYGTGLAVWPALIVVGLARDKKGAPQWPTGVAALVVAVLYLWRKSASAGAGTDFPSLTEGLRHACDVLSAALLLDGDGRGVEVGAVLVAMAVAAVGVIVWRRRLTDTAGWLGLLTFAFGAAALTAVGRAGAFLKLSSNRHASVSALAWLAAAALVVVALRSLPMPRANLRHGLVVVGVVLPLPLIVVPTLSGAEEVDTIRLGNASQDMLAVALKLRIASGSSLWLGGLDKIPSGTEGLLDDVGHHPFSSSFDLGCGVIGEKVPARQLAGSMPEGAAGRMIGHPEPAVGVPRASMGAGLLSTGSETVECVIAVAGDDRVVGAGVAGPKREGYGSFVEPKPGEVGFTVLLRRDAKNPRFYVRFEGDEQFVELRNPRTKAAE